MSTLKIIAALLAVVAGAVAIYWYTRKEPEVPTNDRVNAESFRQLQSEMERLRTKLTEAQVERILDLPHRTTKGQIVKEERPDSPDAHFVLEEAPDAEGGNLLNLYLGSRKQSIFVLFSPDNRIVIAAEYRVRGTSVKYVGPLKANKLRELRLYAQPRLVDDIEKREQEAEDKLIDDLKDSLNRPTATASEPPKPPPLPSETPQTSPAPPSPPANAVVPSSAPPLPETPKSVPTVPSQVANSVSTTKMTSTPANNTPNKPQPLKITLPSGQVLSDAILAVGVSVPTPSVGAPATLASYQENHPNGNVRCRCSASKGKLSGLVTTFYEGNSVESTASYVDGQLNDVLFVWEENRNRLLYAKYTRDKKDGLVCLFHDKQPWLVQEWSKGAMHHEYLVTYADEKWDILDTATLPETIDDESECGQARRQLNDLQKKLLRNANDLKRGVREEFTKEQKKAKPPAKAALPASRNGRP